MRLGVLDSAPVVAGVDRTQAVRAARDRVAVLDDLGVDRLWYTEHHLAGDVASTSPLTLAAVAGTLSSRIRVGAGGVMVRNHAPLVTAEQAACVAALLPGRLDLGLGSAGGSDDTTDAMIRRTRLAYTTFDDDVREVRHHLRRLLDPEEVPEVFVLAGSPRSARVAALLGLPVGLAAHTVPAAADATVAAYRAAFRPSSSRSAPYVLGCLPIVLADDEAEARWWYRSVQQRQLDRLRHGGRPLRRPEDVELDWSQSERYRVDGVLAAAVVGDSSWGAVELAERVTRWGLDEVMAVTDLSSTTATVASHALLRGLLDGVVPSAGVSRPTRT